jgi:hypothetical protein
MLGGSYIFGECPRLTAITKYFQPTIDRYGLFVLAP